MIDPNHSSIHANEQKTHWTKFDNKNFKADDNTILPLTGPSGYGYRKAHFTEEVEQNKVLFGLGKDKIFFDPQWDVRATENLKYLDPNGKQNIILRRLGHLYPTNELRPKFFPKDDYNEPLKRCTDIHAVPHFLHEMGLFPASHYKSLLFTQDFQASGMYHAVVNYNGRWETDVVDDFIPVYEKSGKPIWGMDLEQPWQLIILKFWAKRNYVYAKDYFEDQKIRGGYAGVKNSDPFDFVHYFSNDTWKYTNLAVDSDKFLRQNVNNVHKGHFILKTKNSSFVRDSGLVQNECSYELINLVEETEAKQRSSGIRNPSKSGQNPVYVATVRSSTKNNWTGRKSVVDPQFKSTYHSILAQHSFTSQIKDQKTVNDKHAQEFGIDRCFTLEGDDLKNLFACCYVTPRRIGGDFISGYYKFTYPANRTNALYLQFNIPSETFLDFSVKQLPSNKIEPTGESKTRIEAYNKEHGSKNTSSSTRYLKNKYILVKDNSRSDKTVPQQQFERDYNPLHYETYEIEYLKGYNSGDAHFLRAVKGRYILRLKSETLKRDAHYVINYCSSHELKFSVFQPDAKEQFKLMKDAMTSTIDKVKRITLKHNDDTEMVAYGSTFDYIGYGYIGVKLKKSSKLHVLIDVDPESLKKQGYRLKHQYKHETQPFAIVVNPGEATSIPLKKINENVAHMWPPTGIKIYQK